MLNFKRLPSDIPPSVTGNNAALTETSSGDLILIDSSGARPMATKSDVEAVTKSTSEAVDKVLAEKADISEFRMLAEQYNKAIEVINNLSERLAAIESNYDPTVIN